MDDANRVAVFERARKACAKLLQDYPHSGPLRSVLDQLDYLLALEAGTTRDRAPLGRLNFGVIAAKEVESMDVRVAFLLYAAQEEAKHM